MEALLNSTTQLVLGGVLGYLLAMVRTLWRDTGLLRASAETNRRIAERARRTAERTRRKTEKWRVANENQRVAAEENREDAETDRVKAQHDFQVKEGPTDP